MITRHALKQGAKKRHERIMFALAVANVPASDESINA